MTGCIGIVGCSAEGAALCYRTICLEGPHLLGEHAHPEVILHTHSLAAYVDRLRKGDIAGIGDLMLSSAMKLATAGADVLICPDNTIHQALPAIRDVSPLPWLHIAEVVAQSAMDRNFRKLGIIGTKWLVESQVYPTQIAAYGLDFDLPSEPDRSEIDRIIMQELVCGKYLPNSVTTLQNVISAMKRDGCEAVVLGCTEIPLVINDGNSALPTLDSTRLLARASLEFAITYAH